MGTAWIFASGKGGVGKTTACITIGEALSRLGEHVCIIDADIGLRDADLMLGLENQVVYDLLDVCNQGCALENALIAHPDFPGLALLSAAQFARAKALDQKSFRKVLCVLKAQFDRVLIDCPAGMERGLRNVLCPGELDEAVLLCTPDDVCIRNAERIQGLLTQKKLPAPRLIVNRLDEDLIRTGEMYSAITVAQVLELELLGEVPEDQSIYRGMIQHLPLVDVDCEASKALQRIAQRIHAPQEDVTLPAYGSRRVSLWERWFGPRLKEVRVVDR